MARPEPIASKTAEVTVDAAMPSNLATAPLRVGLAAAVVELERMAAEADTLQNCVSPFLLCSSDGLEAGQALDALTQHLRGLADFLAAVARDCPMDWSFDLERAADPLRLHAQKLRLVYGPRAGAPSAAGGDVELW